MLKALYRITGVIRLALERLVHNPGLTFLALLGVVISVALVSNAAFFAQAVDQVILNQELAAFSEMTGRPSFSTSVYTFPSGDSPVSVELAEELAQNVAGTLSDEVGLPLYHLGTEVHTGNMMMRPTEDDSQYGESEDFLGSVDIAYIANVSDKMTIVAGDPLDPDTESGEVVDVWMHDRLAEKMGINIGDKVDVGINVQAPSETVQVVGIWQAADLDDDFWFENPDATLQNALLVRRQDYINRFQPMVPSKSWYVAWHIILDGSSVYPEFAQDYLYGFEKAQVVINKYLPKARINTPPLDPLDSFVTRGDTLTVLLLSFNLPALGFLLYFLVLSSAIIAQWQLRETAMLVGRGMRGSSILTLTFFEEILLFLVGTPLGVAGGMVLARLMGNTASFLTFTTRDPLPVSMRGFNWPVTLGALLVTLLARLIPAAKATRVSAIEVDRVRARPSRGPLWYRAYLDFLLVIPTYYAYRQLVNRGMLSGLIQDSPADIYQDPLLVLVPTLFILCGALITLRLFPLVMRALDLIANLIPWSTPHLALRQLGRRSHTYINPLLLVIVSLGLGVYTLSMAASVDQWLIDRIYYNVGSDLSFRVTPMTDASSGGTSTPITGEWIPLPANFQDIAGVNAVARVGDYGVSTKLMNSGEIRGRYLAVDRLTFPQVAYFRDDFADETLGGLMNRLATSGNAILVSEEIMEANEIFIGDDISLNVGINYEFHVIDRFKVVGSFKYFPTVYEDQEVSFIGNLEHLNFFIGLTPPHDIWMSLARGYTGDDVLDAIPARLFVNTTSEGDAELRIAEEQAKFERVGVFGTLSVGFLAAVTMAIMGLLIYTYASLRDRLQRFTILRAVGLMRRQISAQVVLEYAFLTAYGSIAGALIGWYASNLFVPLFQFTGEEGVPLPPLIPIIAENEVSYLVLAFVGIIIGLELLVITRALSKRAFAMLKGVFG